MIGMTSAGELITVSHDGSNIRITGPVLPANSWTHAVATYSLTRGLRPVHQRKPLQFLVSVLVLRSRRTNLSSNWQSPEWARTAVEQWQPVDNTQASLMSYKYIRES